MGNEDKSIPENGNGTGKVSPDGKRILCTRRYIRFFTEIVVDMRKLRDFPEISDELYGICDVIALHTPFPVTREYEFNKLRGKMLERYKNVYGTFPFRYDGYWNFGSCDYSMTEMASNCEFWWLKEKGFDFYAWYDVRVKFLEEWLKNDTKDGYWNDEYVSDIHGLWNSVEEYEDYKRKFKNSGNGYENGEHGYAQAGADKVH
jgi:hypothetical protein